MKSNMKISMKKLTRISSLIIGLLCVMACDGFLDEEPFSAIGKDTFYRTNADALAGVAGIYDGLQNTYGQSYFIWGEFRGDNYTFTGVGSGEKEDLINNTIQPDNGGALSWNNLYEAISRANLAIEQIPKIPSFNAELLGEAHMARAFLYFDAVRVWGAVPVFTAFVEGLSSELARPATDGATILEEIVIPDMIRGEELIEQTTNRFRFSKASVWAFQANVYMWLQQYDKAKTALDNIVALGEYELVTNREDWGRLFLNDPNRLNLPGVGQFQEGPELIFSIDFDINDNNRSAVYADFFAGLPSYTRSPALNEKWVGYFPTDSVSWMAKYPNEEDKPKGLDGAGDRLWGDWRFYDCWEEPLVQDPEQWNRVSKYTKINYNPRIDDTDLIVYRYAGILLMLAEAENKLNPSDFTKAISLVNQIRVARQLPQVNAADYSSADEVENLILDERQMELLAEGKRWWDLRRTRKAVEVLQPINGQTEASLVFPYFEGHLITNPMLKQNQ